jgi:acetyl-CoA synthetase
VSEQELVQVSEAQIAVHWQEEEHFYPPAEFIAQANMTDSSIYDRFSLENFPECYKSMPIY